MNTHERIAEDLPLLASGGLPPQRKQEVKAHVDTCRSCQERLADVRRTLAEVRDAGTATAREDLAGFYDERLAPLLREPALRPPRWWLQAAAVLLAFVAGMALQGARDRSEVATVEEQQARVYEAWATGGGSSLTRGLQALSILR